MPEFRDSGLNVLWDVPTDVMTAGLPAGQPVAVPVSVSPAHPSNVVNLVYSIDGGPEQMVRAVSSGPASGRGLQSFVGQLPPVAPGSQLSFRPVVNRGPYVADPRRGGVADSVLRGATPVTDPAPGRFPYAMEFLGRLSVNLTNPPEVIGATPEGLKTAYTLEPGGTVEGPRLNGEVLDMGGDWMTVRPDGIGISSARIVVRTTCGALLAGEYGGVVDFGPDGYAQLQAGGGPATANVQMVPRFVTASDSMKWINRLQCIGIGLVTMSTLKVQYDIYAVNSRAANDAGRTANG